MRNKHKKIYPEKTTHYQGREVVYMVCKALDSDIQEHVKKMHKAGNHNRKAVIRTDENGKEIIHMSMTQAANDLNLDASHISKSCKNGGRCGGYKWRKLKEDNYESKKIH